MNLDHALIIDNFAGGGGASTGIERALGRSPDVAINHDAEAVALHEANHPDTLHLCQNVWKADPREVVRQASARRCQRLGIPFRLLPVGFAWFSPDCKHFSKAKGGKPVEKGIRDLAWVVVHWAKLTRPAIIALENVEEFKDWGPLIDTQDGKRVPCPVSKGLTFKRWVRELKRLGYAVEWRELRACDYGAPTIRKRLFVVARCDGRPIVWAPPSHAKDGAGGLQPWRTAAECIDWGLDCPSIFERERPLAENTLRRIARGVMRYVVNAEKPFIISAAHGGTTGRGPYVWSGEEPLRTQKASPEFGVVQPFTVSVAHGDSGGRREYPIGEPLGVVPAEGTSHAVVQPFVAGIDNKSNGDRDAWSGRDPLRTVTVENRFALVAPLTHHDAARGQPLDMPLATVTGAHRGEQALIDVHVADDEAAESAAFRDEARRMAAAETRFAELELGEKVSAPHVTKFRANSDGHLADEPMHTVTANSFKKRPGGAAPLGLVSAVLVPRYGERPGQTPRARPVDEPMASVVPTQNGATMVAAYVGRQFGRSTGSATDEPIGATTAGGGGKSQLVTAFLAQHNTGNDGHDVRAPLSTIVGKGCTQGVVEAKAAILSHAYTSNTAGGNGDPQTPAKTITTGGHHAVVECALSPEDLAGAERVAAFIAKYYSAAEHGQPVDEPLHTTTAKPRFALVTVHGWPIVDIGLRMLQPRELYRAQGFPDGYVIDGPGPNGRPLTKTAQVRMCGNSVCPPIAQAIAHALVFGLDVAGRRGGGLMRQFSIAPYSAFLTRKVHEGADSGFAPTFMPPQLFDFQRAMVEYAVSKGRAALFEDCGLGKTLQFLTWAQNVVEHTNRPVLVAAPLAVAAQIVREAGKFGIDAARSSDGQIRAKIVVTNYERLAAFNAADFVGVVCDESSILKSFDGARKAEITNFMRKVPYRLLTTATAAPNDYIELGTSSEALGYLGYMDMLNRFFRNDQNNSATRRMYGEAPKWRFKGHAELPFWRWVCSWARAMRRPSDLGFDNRAFTLPSLIERSHLVEADSLPSGMLFSLPATTLPEQREEKKRTIKVRCERAAELATHDRPSIVWCQFNEEADLLERIIPGARQVAGSQPDDVKEGRLMDFVDGGFRVLVTKARIAALGLNFQHCAHVVDFPSHSYEQYYQGVRRCWRFGQTRDVVVDTVMTEGERKVIENRQRKAAAADAMFVHLIAEMNNAMAVNPAKHFDKTMEVPAWAA